MLWADGASAEVKIDPDAKPVAPAPLPAGAAPRSVSLARVGDSLRHGQKYLEIRWGSNCQPDSDLTWDSSKDGFTNDTASGRSFRDELSALGFKVAGDPNNLFKDQEDDGAELRIGALVTDLNLSVCGGLSGRDRRLPSEQVPYIGLGAMKVEWQIYSPVESKVLAKITTTGQSQVPNPQTDVIDALLRGAFADNIRALGATDAFRTIVLSAGPSVSAPRRPTSAEAILLPQGPSRIHAPSEASASVVALFTGDGMGSGFLVSSDGYLLTNRHVVGASKYLKVKWSDGVETIGEVLRSDIGRDIALVKTDPRGRPAIVLRRGGVQAGDPVFAVGTPLDPRLQGSLTQSIVSANRMLDGYNFIQSDAVVNPGNSGGPLLNAKGEAVGVTVAGLGADKAPRGINFFIPIDDALDFLSLKVASTR